MSSWNKTLLIGVDGGGTGCRAAIGTHLDGVLAQAEGACANVATDANYAIENIISTVNAAAQKAGISADRLRDAYVHLGLAGVMTDHDKTRIARALPYTNSMLSDDRATTVAGAFSGQDGYLLSVGTGTIIASSQNGSCDYVGGWGFHVADQGSGAWLGRGALEQVLLCYDGMADHSDLTRSLFAIFEGDPKAIAEFSLSAKPGDYGSLAPAIVSAANDGDQWARATMKRGVHYFVGGLSRLGFQAGDPLCLVGGLGPHYANYLPAEFLSGRVAAKGNALDGAFALARIGALKSDETNSGETKLRGEK